MQGRRGRITKRELKEDEFITRTVQITEYVQQNYPKVLAALGGIVIAVLIGVFIRNQMALRTREAVDALGEVRVAMMQGDFESAAMKAEQLRDDYSGKPAAAQGTLLLADIYFGQQKWAESRAIYETLINDHGAEGPAGYGAWTGLAACIEEQGNVEEAAQEYLTYADRYSESAFAPSALKEAARCFKAAGEPMKAQQALLRIVRDYGASPTARSARAELSQMGVEP